MTGEQSQIVAQAMITLWRREFLEALGAGTRRPGLLVAVSAMPPSSRRSST